jgi:hypothetical protein
MEISKSLKKTSKIVKSVKIHQNTVKIVKKLKKSSKYQEES